MSMARLLSQEFALAQDCFRTALQVRPDDWQLYNRLGATLAKSAASLFPLPPSSLGLTRSVFSVRSGGRAEEAHDFYWQALELRPSFVRARFVYSPHPPLSPV